MQRTVVETISDLSGNPIEGAPVRVYTTHGMPKGRRRVIDMSAAEYEQIFGGVGTDEPARGRPPKSSEDGAE